MASTSFRVRLSCSTTGAGVRAGANRPDHVTTSKPLKPGVSATVGTLGRMARRAGPVTAMPLSLPACTCGAALTLTSMARSTWPPITSVAICAPPR